MTYFHVDAEVPGGLIPGSTYDSTVRAANSGPLHLVFDGWLGDDLVTTSPFWFVTEQLGAALRASGLTGFELEPAKTSTSEQYHLLTEQAPPPIWFRLIPVGSVGSQDDIALEDETELVVNDAALAVLRSFTLEDADITTADENPSPVM